jgi:hypothetical protein
MAKFENYVKEREKINIIETGYNVSDNFWQNFLFVLNNSKGLSELLDVPSSKISTWKEKINNALKAHENKQKEININYKNKILKTGN